MYRELVKPHHRRVCEYLAQDGMPVILHSDDDVRPLIVDFIEAGFTALHPLEAKARLPWPIFALVIGAAWPCSATSM
ncbi:MAG: hypothetical protein CME05_10495 [Gemmatimonadaceae bacterium]|nr:hypothetical protein [Gemmatimonadaceae bacterium]